MNTILQNTKNNKRIVVGLIIVFKLMLMGFFSSDYQNKMFVPFVNAFLSGKNPYNYFYENSLHPSFPYFPLMLLIESVGGLLLKLFNPTSIFIKNLLFKLPLLMFDILEFRVLLRLRVRFKYLVVFYFCSPVILYATYIHGQLDIIPTTLFVLAIYFLLDWKNEHNLLLYAMFLGLAISCKAHILAAVPILFFYVAKKRDYLISIKTLLISFITVAIFTIGFWGEGFIHTVLFNKEQALLTSVGITYGTVSLLIPIAVLIIVYLNAYELNYFNKNLLISMIGILYTLFLICLSPMPAWFIWIVPFYTLYFCFIIEDKYKQMFMYAIFNVIYMIYFCFFHITNNVDIIFLGKNLQWIKVDNASARSIIFTIMVTCLGVIAYKIYCGGIASNNLYRRGAESFAIGIAGDSGAGKSRLLDKIENLFGSGKDVLFIEGDGDHRWARNDNNWEQYTALNPQANFLYRQAEDIKRLKSGNYVFRSEYNHDTGNFTKKKKVNTKKYIYPQKQYADVVITYFDKTLNDCYAENHKEEISVKFELSIDMNVEGLIKTFGLYGVHPEHWICDDLYHQGLSFDGKEIQNNIDFERIAEINIPQYEDFFTYYPQWGKDVEGVIQIILLFMISEKMKG